MIKTIITRKGDNAIVYMSLVTKVAENGLLIDDNYLIEGIEDYNVFPNVDTLDIIETGRYIYTTEKGFKLNQFYKEYVNADEEIESLQKQLALATNRVADLENTINGIILMI